MPAHTPQRPALSRRALSTVVHLTGLWSFAASFLWMPNIANPLHDGFGGSYKFLTIIALTISTVTFGINLLADIFASRRLFTLKSMISAYATPLELFVSITYWGLRTVDKRLVIPPGHEVPFIPDLGLHAMPALMLTLDLLLSPSRTAKASSVVTVGAAFVLLYWAWLEYCFSFNAW